MHHVSFGDVLKEARLARGLDLATVSRELRIRQDIIVAIENSDFTRMPSRGYARNMIIAYARLLGLNAQDISRMYLDQEYAYQVKQAHRSVGDTIQMHDEPYRRGSGDRAGQTGRFAQTSSRTSRMREDDSSRNKPYDGSSNGFGRRMYSQNADEPPYAPRNNASVAHRARRSAMSGQTYTNLYSAPKNIPNPNHRRNVIIGAVVVVLIVIIIVVALALSHSSTPTTNIPVTGVDATTQQTDQNDQAQQAQQQPQETAPTEFTFRYEVADGSDTYIEVYLDGDVQESDDVEGPASQTYTCSSKLRFVSTETDGVTAYINDQEVTLEVNDSGIVNQTFTFEDFLNQWYEDHPNAQRPAASASDSSNSSGSGSSSASGATSRSSDSSGQSSRSSGSSSSSGSSGSGSSSSSDDE